jgi:hypothetical protein
MTVSPFFVQSTKNNLALFLPKKKEFFVLL